MAPSISAKQFHATRITATSPKAFDEVMSSLYASIGTPDKVSEWPKLVKNIISGPPNPKEDFIKAVDEVVGPHGFMIFQEFNHGVWIPLFNAGGGLQSKRVILGNPLIAITMLQHEMTTGLAVPVEILVTQTKEGGSEVVYNLPSGLIAAFNKNEELVKAVQVLDGKLEKLVEDILS